MNNQILPPDSLVYGEKPMHLAQKAAPHWRVDAFSRVGMPGVGSMGIERGREGFVIANNNYTAGYPQVPNLCRISPA